MISPPSQGAAAAAGLAELSRQPLVLPGPENGMRRVVDAACRAARVRPNVVMQLDCVTALKQLVEEGVGCSVLPFGAVHREVRDGRLAARPFRESTMHAMLVLATPSHRPVTRLARLLTELVKTEVRELADAGILRGTTRGIGQRRPAAART
jgi:LysR family nitrogen assimilation transcriptional regulator